MGTIRDYYESENRSMNIQHALSMHSPQGVVAGQTINFKIHLLIDANSKFISIYADESVAFEALLMHIRYEDLHNCDVMKLMGQNDKAEMLINTEGGIQVSVVDLVFSRKIIIYINTTLSNEQKNILNALGKELKINLEVRDKNYAEYKSKQEKPLAFISHAKSDSREFAIKLANSLSRLGCPVWFDEYSMRVGDSLVESIEAGLKETKKCIFILSPDFLANEGWCKHEFKTASMKQIFEKRNIMLPIWHGVNSEDVYQYSAILADTVGVQSSLGEELVAKKLSEILLA